MLAQPASAPRSVFVRPLAVSASVREALAAGAPVVQAVHRLGASLRLPGTDDAVFMSAPGIGLLPAHIIVRTRDLQRVFHALQTTGAANCGEAWSLHIELQGVREFRPRLAPNPAQMRSACALCNVAAAAHWLRACTMPLGLGATAAELLAPSSRWRNSLDALQTGSHPTEASASAGLRALIGHGSGSTPAGDDFATGALAYAWATQGSQAPIVSAMRVLAPELPELTTTIGASYLRAAARGEFGSHLIAWVRALPRASAARALALAERVAGHGATSGYDTLLGFVAAAEVAAGPSDSAGRRSNQDTAPP